MSHIHSCNGRGIGCYYGSTNWPRLHTWMSHVPSMNESCPTYTGATAEGSAATTTTLTGREGTHKWVTSQVWMSHVQYTQVQRLRDPLQIRQHLWAEMQAAGKAGDLDRAASLRLSVQVWEWKQKLDTRGKKWKRHVHMSNMTHSYALPRSFCLSSAFCPGVGVGVEKRMWHDALICVPWLIHMCDMTFSHMCDMTGWWDASGYHDGWSRCRSPPLCSYVCACVCVCVCAYIYVCIYIYIYIYKFMCT